MLHLLDGLKPSYRRMIWTALEHPDKLVKVATLAGVCGGKYSPHSPDSLPAVVSEMVHANIFEGQGSHGSASIYKPWNNDAAAPRYIEAKLRGEFRKMISPLIPFVPYVDSELNSMYKEPTYIPSPVPLAMTFNALGLGIGIRTVTPNFSIKSMLEAYLKNDYTLLRANGDLIIDPKRSDLKSLWEKGRGKVTYGFHLDKKAMCEGKKGLALKGDPRFIQITKLGQLETKSYKDPKKEDDLGWIDKGFVTMVDQSTRAGGKKIYFGIPDSSKGKKGRVTLKELTEELESLRFSTSSYKLAVTDGKTTKVRGLKSWIDETYKNFCSLVNIYKVKKVDKLKMKEKVVINAEAVAKEIMKYPKKDSTEIAKTLSIEEEVVKECLKKSISVLLKTNKDNELKSLRASIKETKLLKPEDFYENIIN
jgi:hypothetical protein